MLKFDIFEFVYLLVHKVINKQFMIANMHLSLTTGILGKEEETMRKIRFGSKSLNYLMNFTMELSFDSKSQVGKCFARQNTELRNFICSYHYKLGLIVTCQFCNFSYFCPAAIDLKTRQASFSQKINAVPSVVIKLYRLSFHQMHCFVFSFTFSKQQKIVKFHHLHSVRKLQSNLKMNLFCRNTWLTLKMNRSIQFFSFS